MIDYCTENLGLSRSALASLLNVSLATLEKWETPAPFDYRKVRLQTLCKVIKLAVADGIHGPTIINYLVAPIDKDGRSALYWIVDEPEFACGEFISILNKRAREKLWFAERCIAVIRSRIDSADLHADVTWALKKYDEMIKSL